MSLSALQLTSSAALTAPTLTRNQTGLSPIQSPQSFNSSFGYTLGTTEQSELDGVICIGVVLAGGGTRTINLVTGNESDPTGDTPVRIATLKEALLAVPSTNADDGSVTPDEGVSVAFNGSMMNALGWAGGAATRTLLRNQRMADSNPTGGNTGADASVTITNLNATDKTTCFVCLCGFRV